MNLLLPYLSFLLCASCVFPCPSRSIERTTRGLSMCLGFMLSTCNAQENKDVVDPFALRTTCKPSYDYYLDVKQPRYSNFPCGVRNFGSRRGRIVGGEEVLKHSYPWMAAIYQFGIYFCGAVIINRRWVISAGHCLVILTADVVVVGKHDMQVTEPSEEHYGVECIDFHPSYVFGQSHHDVVLIKLNRSITYRKEVQPICIPWGLGHPGNLLGEQVTSIGWGLTEYTPIGGTPSPVLRGINLTIQLTDLCNHSYTSVKFERERWPHGLHVFNVLCVASPTAEEGMDACRGDSGGPTMFYNKTTKRYTLDGIISRGYGCGLPEFPGISIPIRNPLTLVWIRDTAFTQSYK